MTDRAPVSVPAFDLDVLLAVATLYVDSFRPSEYMSLAERVALHDVEQLLEKYGRREWRAAATGEPALRHYPRNR